MYHMMICLARKCVPPRQLNERRGIFDGQPEGQIYETLSNLPDYISLLIINRVLSRHIICYIKKELEELYMGGNKQ